MKIYTSPTPPVLPKREPKTNSLWHKLKGMGDPVF
jgi:hypothetical protein